MKFPTIKISNIDKYQAKNGKKETFGWFDYLEGF